MAVGFVESDLVALGGITAVKRAIDAGADHRNVMSNNEVMRLVADMDNSNAWAVGRFDALANQARLPSEVQSQLPPLSWFSAAGHINGGVSGVFKAEAHDRRGRPEPARRAPRLPGDGEACRRAAAPASSRWSIRCSSRAKARLSRWPSTFPSEFFDALEAMAKQKQLNGR